MSIWDKEAPQGGGHYLKLASGESARIRLFGEAIDFEETYPGKQPSLKFASLCLYRNKAERKNEIKGFKFGWTVQKAIRSLVRDEDWGDPIGYDIEITRTGEGMDTKYGVVPKPKMPLSSEEMDLIGSTQLDVRALFLKNASAEAAPSSPTDEYDPFEDE